MRRHWGPFLYTEILCFISIEIIKKFSRGVKRGWSGWSALKIGVFELKKAIFDPKQGGAQGGAGVERVELHRISTAYQQLINIPN